MGFRFCVKQACSPVRFGTTTTASLSAATCLLRPESLMAPMTAKLPDGRPLCIPIAHGEGNYTIDDAGLDAIEDGDQILFRYCGPDGGIGDEFNPNGSVDHIAGVCNAEGNVFGMMPHPERACSEDLGNTDGRAMLEALRGCRRSGLTSPRPRIFRVAFRRSFGT